MHPLRCELSLLVASMDYLHQNRVPAATVALCILGALKPLSFSARWQCPVETETLKWYKYHTCHLEGKNCLQKRFKIAFTRHPVYSIITTRQVASSLHAPRENDLLNLVRHRPTLVTVSQSPCPPRSKRSPLCVVKRKTITRRPAVTKRTIIKQTLNCLETTTLSIVAKLGLRMLTTWKQSVRPTATSSATTPERTRLLRSVVNLAGLSEQPTG
jgi:hypothetical protein